MRALYPSPRDELGDADLAELYAFPAEQGRDGAARVWVRANFVSSLDGAAQGTNLRSGTLSSTPDKQIFRLLRSLCDIIVVGAGTTRAERYQPVKPSEAQTTMRALNDLAPLPAVAVVSRSLKLDPALVRGGAAPTIVITVASAPADALDRVRQVAPVIVAGDHDVDFAFALNELGRQGYRRLLCEGGPTLMRDLVGSGRLDDLCLTLSPLLAAGDRLRVTNGVGFEPPYRMTLQHVLEEDSQLFTRYLSAPSAGPA